MSSWGQSTAAYGGILMPEATSWMHEAHWVKLALVRSTIGSLAMGCTSGGGGGMAIRELACRALFLRLLRTEVSNGALKRVTYRLAPRVVARASRNSLHVGSLSDPNMMYSSLQVKSQIRDTDFTFE